MADVSVDTLKKHCLEYNVLIKLHSDLCNALPIDDLFPSMISNHVIDFRDKADISAEKTERKRVESFLSNYLIKDLGSSEEWDTTRFYRFLTVMKRSHKCEFLVKRINHWMDQYRKHSAEPREGSSTVKGNLLMLSRGFRREHADLVAVSFHSTPSCGSDVHMSTACVGTFKHLTGNLSQYNNR